MKKLSLKNLNLGVNDMLQRNQLKNVFGGGYGACNSHSGCSTGCAYIYENTVKCNSCCIA
jgi:hypothetical protein